MATSLDEVDRSMYSTFCTAANSLSQLYTQAMNHQKLSFQAGERHGLEKLYQWILRQQEGGSRVTTGDVLSYLQTELDYSGEEPPISPRAPGQHQHLQSVHFANSGMIVPTGSSGLPPSVQGFRSEPSDQQSKNYVFSNALSSPVRRSLQNYHISPGGYFQNNVQPSTNGNRSSESNFIHQQTRDPNPVNSNDSAMDMHADSPGHESTY